MPTGTSSEDTTMTKENSQERIDQGLAVSLSSVTTLQIGVLIIVPAKRNFYTSFEELTQHSFFHECIATHVDDVTTYERWLRRHEESSRLEPEKNQTNKNHRW